MSGVPAFIQLLDHYVLAYYLMQVLSAVAEWVEFVKEVWMGWAD